MKYDPLKAHLEDSGQDAIPLTFEEIERIIHASLPRSARQYPEWWANTPTGHVNAQAWLAAGYRAERIDLAEETVVFRRDDNPTERREGRHPIWTSPLQGSVKIKAGVDLTEPLWPVEDDLL